MADDQAKAEELLQQSKDQKRHETEPTTAEKDDTPTLEEAIADAYVSLESGDLHSNLTLRDENLAALFAGLDELGDLERIGSNAAAELDRDADATTKADVLRLLIRIGLSEVEDDVIDAAKNGRKQFLESKTDEF